MALVVQCRIIFGYHTRIIKPIFTIEKNLIPKNSICNFPLNNSLILILGILTKMEIFRQR